MPTTTYLEAYIKRHPDEFSPAQKQIALTRFSDEMLVLVLDTHYRGGDDPECPDPDDADLPDYWARVGHWLRRTVPALAALSDEEIDLATIVAFSMDTEPQYDA